MLCADGNRSEVVRPVVGSDISSSGKQSFAKTTVVLPSRMPTFVRTPPPLPPSSLVTGMPHFDQKLDEVKAARCAAEAMANLSVLPVSAMNVPPATSGTVDTLQSVAVASTAEPEHHGSPMTAVSCTSAAEDMTETSSASHVDKYSSYDRHFKKKFFGSERRPQSSEPIMKVGDLDHVSGDNGRDGNTPSPDMTSSIACKKARLAEPGRHAISPLCAAVRTPTPPVGGVLPLTVLTVSHESQPSSVQLPSDDVLRASPCMLTMMPISSAPVATTLTATSSATELPFSVDDTSAQFRHADPTVTQSPLDSTSTDEQMPPTMTSSS